MSIAVVGQDEFSFHALVVLNVEDVLDVDIQDIPIQKEHIQNYTK
jgi:hypothetical protein